MVINVQQFIDKVRIALDEVARGIVDDFGSDFDNSIRQGLRYCLVDYIQSCPVSMLHGKMLGIGVQTGEPETENTDPVVEKYADGSGYVVMPSDYLRFIEFKLISWSSTVRDLIDPMSDEARRQVTRWGRGTPHKPRCMMSIDRLGNKILRYWTAGRYSASHSSVPSEIYDHRIDRLVYAPHPQWSGAGATEQVNCALLEEYEKNIVYLTAAVVLESKQETELAQRIRETFMNRE